MYPRRDAPSGPREPPQWSSHPRQQQPTEPPARHSRDEDNMARFERRYKEQQAQEALFYSRPPSEASQLPDSHVHQTMPTPQGTRGHATNELPGADRVRAATEDREAHHQSTQTYAHNSADQSRMCEERRLPVPTTYGDRLAPAPRSTEPIYVDVSTETHEHPDVPGRTAIQGYKDTRPLAAHMERLDLENKQIQAAQLRRQPWATRQETEVRPAARPLPRPPIEAVYQVSRPQIGPIPDRGPRYPQDEMEFVTKPITMSRLRDGTPVSTTSLATHITSPVSVTTEKLREVGLTSFCVRPEFGKKGQPLIIVSNFFSVKPLGARAKIIHHYDVQMDPVVAVAGQRKPKLRLRSLWRQLCLEEADKKSDWARGLDASAFDGRHNAFTPYKLPLADGESRQFIVAISPDNIIQRVRNEDSSSDDEWRRWKIVVKLVADIDMQDVMRYCAADKAAPSREEECLTAIMATNVLMRDFPSQTYTQSGASGNRFYTLDNAVPISHGAVVCRGFMQSFGYSSSGLPLLNIDVGYSAFLASGPLLKVIPKILSRAGGRDLNRGYLGGVEPELNSLTPQQILLLKSKLRGARFTVTHRASSRLHTIMSISTVSAEQFEFELQSKDGSTPSRRISVVQYYEEQYVQKVRFPRLPCVQYGAKKLVPMEFVNLEDWNCLPAMKLSPEQTAEMIKLSAVKPQERAKQINMWREELHHETQPKIAAWGWQVNSQMIRIQARILPPPKIAYARGQEGRPNAGEWDIRDKQFVRNGPQPLKAWSVVSFDRFFGTRDMQRYVQYLCRIMESHGIEVANQRPECFEPVDPREEENVIHTMQMAARSAYVAGKCSPQLICIILPGRDAWLYELIKRVSFTQLKGELDLTVFQGCMQAAKLRTERGIKPYTDNLVMKIQSKLGGLTHRIPISELPGMERGKTMILGADLGHPPIRAGQAELPTVACSIATTNPDCDSYSPQIRLQSGRADVIADLSTMVEAHLRVYKTRNDTYPERILIFRDGVSEGQYAAVLHHEHSAVLDACERLEPGYRPRILLCICAKRHNTRFFGKLSDTDPSGNLPSGLVVDRTVTHPYVYDFFLQSHAARVGTARPTHYICLLDELGMTPDMLQQMVHNLCFSFARCTKSVSIVPVCYIADLVCQKARIIIHEPTHSTQAPSNSSNGKGGRPTPNAPPSTVGSTMRKRGAAHGFDIMQVQNLLERNQDLGDSAWWM